MKRISMFVAVVAMFASTVFAQNGVFAPYVKGSVSSSANAGYKNPDYTAGAGVESSSKYMLLDLNGSFDSANAVKTDNGYTGTVAGTAYYKLFGHLLAGGGATWQLNTAQVSNFVKNFKGQSVRQVVDATRQSAHPLVGGGFQFSRVRVLATYALPGKDALTNERLVDVNSEIFIKKHFRLTQFAELNSYVGAGKIRATANKLGAGVKFVL
jgi:hypothetical protein